MAATLFFVHGTGVRQAGYNDTMQKLKDGLKTAGRTDIPVAGYLWGDVLGASFSQADVDSVLPSALARAIDDASQWEAALWEMLLRDPLFELRMASMREETDGVTGGAPLPGAGDPADVVVVSRVAALPGRLDDPIPGGMAKPDLTAAAIDISESEELAEAAAAAPDVNDPDLNEAIARAIVADALNRARGEPGTGPDALYAMDQRRQLVEYVAARLASQTRGIGGWLKNKIVSAAETWATRYGKDRRTQLMTGAGPGIGDILLYQRRGQAILDALEAKIVELAQSGPVVALGHSLGGIMLVDLLSRPRAEGPVPVTKLITVGSQSPAFYECDALATIRKSAPAGSAQPFTPWLNIFDRNDFLSFCATRCFAGSPAGIEDFEVSSGVSFPDSHSAYFRQRSFYAKIVTNWP